MSAIAPTFALATASYAGDFARCALLCASIDRFVTGWNAHYIMVDDIDLELFRPLATDRRRIITESMLFPSWLKSRPDPATLGRRRVWTGIGALRRGVPPLRGWHAQQLRKLCLPAEAVEDIYLYADSDVIFLRPFDMAGLVTGQGVRLYRNPAGITAAMGEHAGWCQEAARVLGLPAPQMPCDDYINNLVTWTKANVLGLHRHIGQVTGRDWISAITAKRGFSEYSIYGFYVDQVLGTASGHAPTPRPLARTYWDRDAIPQGGLAGFEHALAPDQVAVGVQSFIGEPVEKLRGFFDRA